MIEVLLMYVVDYSDHVYVWNKWYAYGPLVSLLSICEVMRLHIYIALVCLDWDYEKGLMML